MKKLILVLSLSILAQANLQAAKQVSATAPASTAASSTPRAAHPALLSAKASDTAAQHQVSGYEYAYKITEKAAKQDYKLLTPNGRAAIERVIKLNQKFAPSKTDAPQDQMMKKAIAFERLISTINGVCAMIPNAKQQIPSCKALEL